MRDLIIQFILMAYAFYFEISYTSWARKESNKKHKHKEWTIQVKRGEGVDELSVWLMVLWLSLDSKGTGLNLGGDAEEEVGEDLRLSTEEAIVEVTVAAAAAARLLWLCIIAGLVKGTPATCDR